MNLITPLLFALLVLLGACGDGEGNDDTLWTGLSGVIIFVVIAVIVVRMIRKHNK